MGQRISKQLVGVKLEITSNDINIVLGFVGAVFLLAITRVIVIVGEIYKKKRECESDAFFGFLGLIGLLLLILFVGNISFTIYNILTTQESNIYFWVTIISTPFVYIVAEWFIKIGTKKNKLRRRSGLLYA